MKKYMTNFKSFGWLTGALSLCLTLSLGSCTEEIDESNFAIAEKQTVSEYVASVDSFSSIKALFDRVKLGRGDEASSLTSALSTRGNYTVFLPGNFAFQHYLDSIGVADVASLSDEQADVIANSCIIDNGTLSAYESADFPNKGSFKMPNLKSRLVDCYVDSDGEFIIGGKAKVVKSDIELSNGMVHIIDAVIAPSNKTLPNLIAAADNMKIMGHLLSVTTWADSLQREIDNDYENESAERPEQHKFGGSLAYRPFNYPAHRFYGYTAFVETDDVFASEWGITLPENPTTDDLNGIMTTLEEKCKAAYPGSTNDGNYKHPDNAVNKFVAYHLIKGKMAYNQLVVHFNEYAYKYGTASAPQTTNIPTNVWDYHTTMGNHPALLKIVQVGNTGQDPQALAADDYNNQAIFLNRISKYANDRRGDYHEIEATQRGVKVIADNGSYDNNSVNGYYFPIDRILVNDAANINAMGRERIRFDLSTVLHEYLSNSIRGGDYTICPNGYFENICNESADTKICYLNAGIISAPGWNDYQGDETLVLGLYDFTIKLPPVPKSGTYEIRMGQAFNDQRGMCQLYFGDSPYSLQPAGLPLDQRQSAENNPAIPWVKDVEDDDELNAENDKNMRNQGYMKAPQYYTITDGTGENPVRGRGGAYCALRRIVGIYELDANKTYYIRLKSALKKLDSQCFLDYFEYVPNNIYNGTEPEDIW